MEVRRCEGKARDKMEQRNPQEILAVPVDNSPSWPIPVLSISLSVHLPIIPSEDGAKTRVEIHFSPSGPGWFAHPQEASHSTPRLSLPTFPTEHLFKKKNLKKKRKKSHHREWVTNTAGKIHGEHWWEGASPSLASQQPVSYLHCSQVLCTAQAERGALPRNNNVYSSMPPTRSREGTGQTGEGETETHEGVCVGNESRGLQRNLIEASASTG